MSAFFSFPSFSLCFTDLANLTHSRGGLLEMSLDYIGLRSLYKDPIFQYCKPRITSRAEKAAKFVCSMVMIDGKFLDSPLISASLRIAANGTLAILLLIYLLVIFSRETNNPHGLRFVMSSISLKNGLFITFLTYSSFPIWARFMRVKIRKRLELLT